MSYHALNGVCPYFTMYPLDFPLRVLRWRGKRGEWVLDPFCGRGTTNFAARLLGMPSVGIDSSPVAVALTQAKLAHARADEVVACARAMLADGRMPGSLPSGDFWEFAYHENTLRRLCVIRESLLADCSSQSRLLLRAIVLGALHGPMRKGAPSYFSNQSPRTYAPKPGYAVRYWRSRDMLPRDVDVLSVIAARAERYLAEPLPRVDGCVELGNSRVSSRFDSVPKARFVVTSPPYFGMRTYLPDQWLRYWFLGGPDRVKYKQPQGELGHTSPAEFAAEMGRVWVNVAARSTEDARLVIRYGGIHERCAEPMDLLRLSLENTGWRTTATRLVPDADSGRRQVRQFQAKPMRAIPEHDVYCSRA